MEGINPETSTKPLYLSRKEVRKTAFDLLGQLLRPSFKPDNDSLLVKVNHTLGKKEGVWRLDFVADEDTPISFGFQVKKVEERGVVRDKVNEVRFRVGKDKPIISLTEQGFRKHHKPDDEGEKLSKGDHRDALENWRTVKSCLAMLEQETSAKEKKKSKRRAGRLAAISTVAALTAASLPLFAPTTVAEAPTTGKKISQQAEPKAPTKEKGEELSYKVYLPTIEGASSLYNKVKIEGIDVYGSGAIKVDSEDDLANLLDYLDRQFKESGEELNPNNRYLEYFVLQSVWDQFVESGDRGELVRFVKRHVDYLNNMKVGDGTKLTGEVLKDSGTEVKLRRVVVLDDEAFRNWSMWKSQRPEDFHRTSDINARWTMKGDYRKNGEPGGSDFWDEETQIDYGLPHEGIHYWEGYMTHTNDLSIIPNFNSFRELTNPDGSPIPESIKNRTFYEYHGGIMSDELSRNSYVEDIVFYFLKRMNELGRNTLTERIRFLGQKIYTGEEVAAENNLILKNPEGESIPEGSRVLFYKTKAVEVPEAFAQSEELMTDHQLEESKKISELSRRQDVKFTSTNSVRVFDQSSQVEAVVTEGGRVVFPQEFLTALVERNGAARVMNKNYFMIVVEHREEGNRVLYQHLTANPFTVERWKGNIESAEVEVELVAP